ncbi:MAG: RNHCP domain-containing protein, partial [Patescibacteria group bacterium]|nr:RNHCP domain-containing protein [Patescibacteria group bacterium]
EKLLLGIKNRNHCPFCLWSKHVDEVPGDRNSSCQGKMEPLALTFKTEGVDKYGQKNQGELMLVHQCLVCNKFSINRIAGDDDNEKILEIFTKSKSLDKERINELKEHNIKILTEKDKKEADKQLFGKK